MLTDEERTALEVAQGALPGQTSIYDQLPESGDAERPADSSSGVRRENVLGFGHSDQAVPLPHQQDAAEHNGASDDDKALPPDYEYPEGNDSVYDWRKAKFHKNAIDAEYRKMLEAKKDFGDAYKRVAMFYGDFHESMERIAKSITEFYKEINKTKF